MPTRIGRGPQPRLSPLLLLAADAGIGSLGAADLMGDFGRQSVGQVDAPTGRRDSDFDILLGASRATTFHAASRVLGSGRLGIVGKKASQEKPHGLEEIVRSPEIVWFEFFMGGLIGDEELGLLDFLVVARPAHVWRDRPRMSGRPIQGWIGENRPTDAFSDPLPAFSIEMGSAV